MLGLQRQETLSPNRKIAGQIIYTHVKYIAVMKGKNIPEEHRDYSLEEDLGKHQVTNQTKPAEREAPLA